MFDIIWHSVIHVIFGVICILVFISNVLCVFFLFFKARKDSWVGTRWKILGIKKTLLSCLSKIAPKQLLFLLV